MNILINEGQHEEAAAGPWGLLARLSPYPSGRKAPPTLKKNPILSACVLVWASDFKTGWPVNWVSAPCAPPHTKSVLWTEVRLVIFTTTVWINLISDHSLLELQLYRGICASGTLGAMFSRTWTRAPVRDTTGEIISDEEPVKRIVLRIKHHILFWGVCRGLKCVL